MAPIIEVKNLTKEYIFTEREEGLKSALKSLIKPKEKKVVALDNISFTIDEGEFVGIIGPNGAGKSTLIKTLTGILTPTKGTVIVNSRIPFEERIENAKIIGVIFGNRSKLEWDLPVIDTFKLLKAIYRVSDKDYEENLSKFIDRLKIKELLYKPVRSLSLGQKIKCEIVGAFLHNPKIVYLDEPTIGLDIFSKEEIHKLLLKINREKRITILLTTHDMKDISKLCRRVILLNKGKIIYDGPIQKLKSKFEKKRMITFLFTSKIDRKSKKIKELAKDPAIEIIDWKENELKVVLNLTKIKIKDFIKKILDNYDVVDVRVEDLELEEIIKTIYEER
ncbi:MAG: ATP-binding cassette domain-containing protein [Candidatus Micrarchaeia archaeon]